MTLLASLLLSPLLKTLTSETKQPVVVIAQDGSESIANSLADKTAYLQSIAQLKSSLEDDYEVQTYTFGSGVKEGLDSNFTEKVTNISAVLKEVYDRFSNQNLGAVFLASDGIYNEGSNPIYTGTKLEAPIFTIALGDTTPQKDLILKRVLHNNIAYLKDEFTIQADISARNLSASRSVLQVGKVVDGKFLKLKESTININRADYFSTVDFVLPADQAGVQRFRARLLSVNGEVSTVNNAKDFFVDVLDARQKILLLANAPHPDLSAIKQTLTKNKNYEVEIAIADEFKKTVQDFSFVVLHQLPAKTQNSTSLLASIEAARIPTLSIWGSENIFTTTSELIPFAPKAGAANEVTAVAATNFDYFNISEELRNLIPKFPPLLSPFGEYKTAPTGQTLLKQKIGSVGTDYPLLTVGEKDGVKKGVLAAEGIWKWRLFDYLQNDSHELSDEFISKVVQYLSTKEDKRKFRVSQPKNVFKENESISLDAELYNSNYQLINSPETTITLRDGAGKEYNYTFSKTTNAYRLNAGVLPVGNYKYKAKTAFSGEQFDYDGQFSVQPIQLELFNTTADHALLNVLSRERGGKVIFPNEIEGIPALLKEEQKLTPIIYQSSLTQSVINLKWICWLLLIIFGVEWFIRRYMGSY